MVLYCIAIGCLFLPSLKQALIIYQTQMITDKMSRAADTTDNAPVEAVQPPSIKDVLKFDTERSMNSVGQLVVPKTEISVPLFSGVTTEQLLVGVGTLFPERGIVNQNFVIIGHHLGRENLLLGRLSELAVGDSIYLEYQKHVYKYQVSDIRVIQQTNLSVLKNDMKSEITVITCDKPTQTTQRIMVRGILVEEFLKNDKRNVLIKKVLIRNQNEQEDRNYCLLVIFLLFCSLFFGLWSIHHISKLLEEGGIK